MNGLIHAHSGLRYLILLGFIWVIITYITKKNQGIDGAVKRPYLITFILCHIQLLLGIILYATSAKSALVFEDFGMAMENDLTRFYGLEHAFGMIAGITVLTVGYSKSKKIQDRVQAHKKAFMFYMIALVAIFVSIPWPFLKEFGTWF